MKKFWAAVLAVMLALSAASAAHAEEDIWVEFTPIMTTLISSASESSDLDVDDWFSSSYNRAILTVSLLLDLSLTLAENPDPAIQDFEFSDVIYNTSYVGSNVFILFATYQCDDCAIHIAYTPFDSTANYMISEAVSDSAIEEVLSATCTDGYYKNRLLTIIDAVQLFTDALAK